MGEDIDPDGGDAVVPPGEGGTAARFGFGRKEGRMEGRRGRDIWE